jgi:hypothetical protein
MQMILDIKDCRRAILFVPSKSNECFSVCHLIGNFMINVDEI